MVDSKGLRDGYIAVVGPMNLRQKPILILPSYAGDFSRKRSRRPFEGHVVKPTAKLDVTPSLLNQQGLE